MNIRTVLAGLVLAVLALPAMAQDVSGKWNASIESPQGALALVFNFTREGDMLKGTIANDFTGEAPISDGKIEGDVISFKSNVEAGPAGAMVISYTGKIEADKITLTMGMDGAPAGGAGGFEMPALTLTRAAE